MDNVFKNTDESSILLFDRTKGIQMLWTTWHLQGEINNGGFCQYFDDNENLYMPEILMGYYEITKNSLELLDCFEIKRAFEEALVLYTSKQSVNNLVGSVDDAWNRLANEYYNYESEFLRKREDYISNNLKEFIME